MSTRRQPDWLLTMSGGILGLFFAGAIAWFTMLDEGPTYNPFETVVSYVQPRQPGVPATVDVYLLGGRLYSRTAPNPEDFDFETGMFHFVTPGLLTVWGGFLGAGAGMLFRKPVSTPPVRGKRSEGE